MLRKNIFIYGFAIFSMFFGSGNLVFPLQIGQESGVHWVLGFLGLSITGILLPFCGLFVIKIHRGSYNGFFAEAGSYARVIIPLFTLSLLGAFGVVPRCITVAYGGIAYIAPQTSIVSFSLVFCALCFVCCLKDNSMINILGKWMTPILLISLALLIGLGIIYAPSHLEAETSQQSYAVFAKGFSRGYQTMDLFAAFFFSSLIFKQIQAVLPEGARTRDVIKLALKPSLIGAGLLGVVYFGFVFLGAYYKHIGQQAPSPELILPVIASHIMGTQAALLIGVIIFFSCLTTAVALNNIYAQYLCSLFKLPSKKFPLILFGTTAASFFISLLDFKGIAAFLAPALEVSYPSLILLTFMTMFLREHKLLKMIVFYAALVFMLYRANPIF